MQRLPRGPRPASSGIEDRKAIEQRARDAALPFAPEKKGQWPFPIEDMEGANEANGSQEVHHASDPNYASDLDHASDPNHASARNVDDQTAQNGQTDQ